MKRSNLLSVIFLVVVSTVLIQCKKKQIDPPIDATPAPNTELVLGASDFKQLQIVVFEKIGINAQLEQYQGTIASLSVPVPVVVQGDLISFVIPDNIGANFQLQVNIDGVDYTSTVFSISAVSAISDPDLVFNSYVTATNLFNSSSTIIDSLDIHTEFNTATLHSDQVVFENYMSNVVSNYNSLAAADKMKIAVFIRANEAMFNDFRQIVDDVPSEIPSYMLKSILTDWENKVNTAMQAFKLAVIKTVAMSGCTAAVILGASIFIPGLQVVAVGIVVGTFSATFLELLKKQQILLNTVIEPDLNSQTVNKSGIIFLIGQAYELNVKMDYTSIHAGTNFGQSVVSSFKNSINKFVDSWNSLIQNIPFTTTLNHVEDISTFKTKFLDVHGSYLSVSNISNPNVNLVSQNVVGGRLALTFNTATPDVLQEFTYTLKYDSPFKTFTKVQNGSIGAEPLHWVEAPTTDPENPAGAGNAVLYYNYAGGVGVKTMNLSGVGDISSMAPNCCFWQFLSASGQHTVTVTDSDVPPNVITAIVNF